MKQDSRNRSRRIRRCIDCGAEDEIRIDNPGVRCRRCSARRGGLAMGILRRQNANRIKCSGCGVPFRRSRTDLRKENYCTPACRIKTTNVERICKQCGEFFSVYRSVVNGPTNATGDFCSKPCYSAFLATITGQANPRYKRVAVKCGVCSKDITVIPSRAEMYERHFCSRACFGVWKGESSRGPLNGYWKGGHKQYRGPDWVSERRAALGDKPFCRICGTTERIDIHHIVPFKFSKSNAQENLTSLCRRHHPAVERITYALIRKMNPAVPSITEVLDFVNRRLYRLGIGMIAT